MIKCGSIQLIDAGTGSHLWADRFDGKLDDVFALQDKVIKKIVDSMEVKITSAEDEIGRAAALNPNDRSVMYDMAFIYYLSGKYKRAIDLYKKVMAGQLMK